MTPEEEKKKHLDTWMQQRAREETTEKVLSLGGSVTWADGSTSVTHEGLDTMKKRITELEKENLALQYRINTRLLPDIDVRNHRIKELERQVKASEEKCQEWLKAGEYTEEDLTNA